MILRQFFYYKEIYNNKRETAGVVTKIEYTSRGSYTLSYTYQVNEKIYENHFGVSGFIGDNGKKGCVGCTFRVYYSSKDHEKSRLYLGKYERHKTTVEFFDFEDENLLREQPSP